MPAFLSNFSRIAGPGVEILRFSCEEALRLVTLDRDPAIAAESEGFVVLPNPALVTAAIRGIRLESSMLTSK
jgi:hypothetical protein